MSFLAGDGSQVISFPLSADSVVTVSKLPMLFESPVTYQIVEEQPEAELPDNIEYADEVGISEDEEEEA